MSELRHIHFVGYPLPQRWGRGAAPVLTRRRALVGPPPALEQSGEAESEGDPLFQRVLEQAGLDPSAYRTLALERRRAACLRVLGAPSVDVAARRLSAQPELLPQALSALLIGVSEFFRDAAVFEQLRRMVLPELLRRRGAVRVYSAGSAMGQELYSVAMLLDDLGGLGTSEMLGMDCRREAVAQAAAGWFPASAVAGMAPGWRRRYFLVEGAQAEVVPRLRTQVQWQIGDVLTQSPPGSWDLVLCRNLAIYLAPPWLVALWSRLVGLLSPGGVLVTGKAEQPTPGLGLRRLGPCVYQKTE